MKNLPTLFKDADIDKFVQYLEKHKSNLEELYKWNAKIEGLVELEIITEAQLKELNKLTPFNKEINLKKIVGQKLNDSFKSNKEQFDKLCLWVIKEWGGIKSAKDEETLKLIQVFINQENPNFERIASTSKVGAYMYPDKNVIYDSRVAYSINWIILSQNIGQIYFPIPSGRNSKMSAFDMNVLIRLKNISFFKIEKISQLDNKYFIKNSEKQLFINKSDAFSQMNKLIKRINQILWKGDKEREENLYYTEMLLFSIADREIFMDIMRKYDSE